jgi:hypothetical protein
LLAVPSSSEVNLAQSYLFCTEKQRVMKKIMLFFINTFKIEKLGFGFSWFLYKKL